MFDPYKNKFEADMRYERDKMEEEKEIEVYLSILREYMANQTKIAELNNKHLSELSKSISSLAQSMILAITSKN